MKLLSLAFLTIAASGTAKAQNSDLGVLVGLTPHSSGFGGQINYAVQIANLEGGKIHPRGRLYLELPVAVPSDASAVYLLPGIRYHVNLSERFVVYASVGVAIALQPQNYFSTSETVEVGAGVDFRLSRRWSLRTDVRSTPSVTFGPALHF